jgi:hypothetical protein
VFSVVLIIVIASMGIGYFTWTPGRGVHPSTAHTTQEPASGWSVIKTNLTVYYGTACIPVEYSGLSCPTENTASYSPSLNNVDLISYQGQYYYDINFTYYMNGQPVTRTIWFTNSTLFCMSPPQSNSGYNACPTHPIQQTTIAFRTTASNTASPSLGLQLKLGLAANGPNGGSLTITIQEWNTLNRVNNVTAANAWRVPPSNLTDVYMGGVVGFAIYNGTYDSNSLTLGKPLPLMEIGSSISCTGCSSPRYYLFQPLTDNATAFPVGSFPYYAGSSALISLNVTVSGYWTSGTQFEDFPPGTYTVAASDQWGQVVLLQFTVKSSVQ